MCGSAGLCVVMCTPAQGSAETKRGHQIPWVWHYKQLWAVWYRCWESKSGSLEEQYMLLITEPPLQATWWTLQVDSRLLAEPFFSVWLILQTLRICSLNFTINLEVRRELLPRCFLSSIDMDCLYFQVHIYFFPCFTIF